MKEKIKALFELYVYDVVRVYENDMYLYFVLNSTMVCSIMLSDLINEGYTFIIDLHDSENNKLTIAFEK